MFAAVVEPPEVTLSGSGSRVAGTSYTLTCTVTPPTGVQFDSSFPPNIQWSGPDTTLLTPTVPSQISNGVYVSTVTLSPLQETHSGQYSCSASYSLGGISSEVVTEEMNITVISELYIMYRRHVSNVCYIFVPYSADCSRSNCER